MTFIGTAAQSPVVPDDPKGARQPRATNTLREWAQAHEQWPPGRFTVQLDPHQLNGGRSRE